MSPDLDDDDEIYISKSVMPELPEGYEESVLGDPRGAIRQFRGSNGLHVREYEDGFLIHRDRFDPRIDPVMHLLADSPETLLAIGSAMRLLRKHESQEKQSGISRRNHCDFGLGSGFGLFRFIFAFLSLNSLFRRLKHLLF